MPKGLGCSLVVLTTALVIATIAGMSYEAHSFTVTYAFLLLVALLIGTVPYKIGFDSGREPLTELDPGLDYRVEAVFPTLTARGGHVVRRYALSWHVDMGFYAYHIAELRYPISGPEPQVGDRLHVRPDERDVCYVEREGVTDVA